MTVTMWEVSEVSHLAGAAQRHTQCLVTNSAMVGRESEGGYLASPDRAGGGGRNRSRVSRNARCRVAWGGVAAPTAVAHSLPRTDQRLGTEPRGGCRRGIVG